MHPLPRIRIANVDLGGQRLRYGVRAGPDAEPALLILNGLGANIELAEPFIDALPGRTVVIFDVPGVGGSPAPRRPYRPATIARLAERLVFYLGHDVTDVLGVSWGGAIAQQFAFRNPRHCRKLVLAATAPGALIANPRILLKMASPRRYVDAAHAHQVAGDLYGGAFRHDPALVARTLEHVRFGSRSGYYLQLAAIFGWTSLPWLWTLRQPTLIMAGIDDPIVPDVNARIMHSMIPNAQLAMVDCGHLFLVTRPELSARIVNDFLSTSISGMPS